MTDAAGYSLYDSYSIAIYLYGDQSASSVLSDSMKVGFCLILNLKRVPIILLMMERNAILVGIVILIANVKTGTIQQFHLR